MNQPNATTATQPNALQAENTRLRAELAAANLLIHSLRTQHLLTCGDITLNLFTREVYRNGTQIEELTSLEFKALEYLVRNQGEPVPKALITQAVWGRQFLATNTLDVAICRMRVKVDAGFDRKAIKTVRGTGYMITSSI